MFRRRRLTAAVALLVVGALWGVLEPGGVGNAVVAKGLTERVSVVDSGSAGPGTQATLPSSQSQVSADGTQDVFVSQSDLDSRYVNNCCDEVFVRDRTTKRTVQISVGTNGGQDGPGGRTVYVPNGANPTGSSDFPSISANGRYVSFVTRAANLAGGPGRHTEGSATFPDALIVVCDRDPDGDGTFDEFQPVSGGGTSSGAARAPNAAPPGRIPDYVCVRVADVPFDLGLDGWPRLSGAGDRIVWSEEVHTTVPGGEFPTAVIRDATYTADLREAGALSPPASRAPLPGADPITPAGSQTDQPAISDDGRHVAVHYFQDRARPGFDNPDTFYEIQEFDLDASTGNPRRVDAGTGGFDNLVQHPSLSANGSRVAFDVTTEGSDFAQPESYAVLNTAAPTPAAVLVSSTYQGTTPGDGEYPWLSADGRYVAFVTDKINMHEGAHGPPVFRSCTGGDSDEGPAQRTPCQIVVRDLDVDATRLATGASRLPAQLATVSIRRDCVPALPSTSVCSGAADSLLPSLSRNGAVVGFESLANDLVPGDTNTNPEGENQTIRDVFVRRWDTTLSASDVSFGVVKTGASTDRTITVTAGGFGPVSIGTANVTGTNGGDFHVVSSTCANRVLHETETCTVTVRFTPQALGSRTGRVNLFADANNTTPKLTVDVTGTGSRTPPKNPDISINPVVVNFGSDIPLHLPGKHRQVTVTNPGGSALTITSVDVIDTTVPGAGGDYTVSLGTCATPVPAGGSCQLTVTFIGHQLGVRPAGLLVTSNAPAGTNTIGMTATVPAPVITASPSVTPTGRVTMVTGNGFAPKRTVELSFTTSNETADVKTDASGHFRVGLVIFPKADVGPRTIVAHVVGADASLTARTPLLVVLGTLQSPGLVNRH